MSHTLFFMSAKDRLERELILRPVLRRVLTFAGLLVWIAVIAVGGFMLGLRLAAPQAHQTALGQFQAELMVSSHGEVDLFVPIVDWGVRAPLFDAPFKLAVEPRVIEREVLLGAAGGDPKIFAAAQSDFERAGRQTIERGFLWGLAGVLLITAIGLMSIEQLGLGHRRLRLILAILPISLALVFVAGSLIAAATSFDVRRSADTSYYARGGELRRLLGIVGRTASARQGYKNQIQRTITSYAALLGGLTRLPGADSEVRDEQRMLLLSDLHGNVSSLDAISELVPNGRKTNRWPALITGDLANRGDRGEIEALRKEVLKLAAQRSEVLVVSGNHDSALMMSALAEIGVKVLGRRGRLRPDGWDGDPIHEVLGMTIAAWDDPLEWKGPNPGDQKRAFSYTERPNGATEQARDRESLDRWFDSLPERPDLLMIHDVSAAMHLAAGLQARGSAERDLLILTGHDHRQHIERYGNILVLDSGTAGAGGLLGAGSTPVSFAELSFRPGKILPASADMINVEPISGEAEAQRIVPSSSKACRTGYVNCHP